MESAVSDTEGWPSDVLTYLPKVVLTSWELPPEVTQAYIDLNEARHALNYSTPCEANATRWDDKVSERESAQQIAARVVAVRPLCLDCLVRDQCALVAEVDGAVSGIYGGELYGDSQVVTHARELLAEMGGAT